MADVLRLILSEFAATNRDGTYTIVRGGIDHWETDLPLNLSLSAVLELPPNALSLGVHAVACTLKAAAGMKLLEVRGELEVVEPGRWTRIVLPLYASVQNYGSCLVEAQLAEYEARGTLDVRPIKA